MDYDEDKVLTDYVWNQCTHLMTQFEQLGYKAVLAQFKAENSSPVMARMILDKWGEENNPEVATALKNGVEEFRTSVRNRVLEDNPSIINRCPECNKVDRTPRAKQCQWCHYDWH